MAGEQQQQQDKEQSSESKEQQQEQENGDKTQQKKGDKTQQKETRPQQDRSRRNKLYRTPPTPTKDELVGMESNFTLDGVAMSSISRDFSNANPKLGSVIPPYNAQKDNKLRDYFKIKHVQETLRYNMQNPPRDTSMEGAVYDRFYQNGAGYRYLTPRAPCGYSNEFRMGHNKESWVNPNPRMNDFEKPPLEPMGYNGKFGYRRNTPGLREKPSPFGVNTDSPIY